MEKKKILKIKKPGLRIIKTVIAVFLSLVLSQFRPGGGLPIQSSIAAIISLQTDVKSTGNIGVNRILGTILGGIVGLLYLLIIPHFDDNYILNYLIISLITGLIIRVMATLGKPNALVIMAIVFLGIALDYRTESVDSTIIYSLNRTIDNLIGVIVAIFINRIEFYIREKRFLRKNGIDKRNR